MPGNVFRCVPHGPDVAYSFDPPVEQRKRANWARHISLGLFVPFTCFIDSAVRQCCECAASLLGLLAAPGKLEGCRYRLDKETVALTALLQKMRLGCGVGGVGST